MSGIVGYAIVRSRGADVGSYLEEEIYRTREDAEYDAEILRDLSGSEYRLYELWEVTE